MAEQHRGDSSDCAEAEQYHGDSPCGDEAMQHRGDSPRGDEAARCSESSSHEEMIRKAFGMLSFSYVPYSHFHVGAALLSADGRIFTGCNIENASFTPTICAERTAFFKAVSEGVRDFKAICIVGGREGVVTDYCPPCGVCRQVMMEFCDPETFEIKLAKSTTDYKVYKLKEIMPLGFSGADLSK